MSDLQFTLELVEEITGPARLAQQHLKKLQDQAKAAGKALDFSEQAKRSVEELARIKLDPKGFLVAHEATRKLAEEQRKLIRQHEGFGGGLKNALTGMGSQFSAVALGELAAEGIAKGAETLLEVFAKGAELVKEGVALAFEASGQREHLEKSFKYVFGKEGAKEALEQADALSHKLAYNDDQVARMLGELGRAGIKGQSAANSLALAADTGAISPTGQGADEALASLTRLKRHGEFSPRLAEGLNINLTDFYAAIGKKLNISSAEAQKKLAQPGAVGFNTIQNTLLDLSQKQTGVLPGTAAIEQSEELLERWKKIKQLPEQYLQTLSSTAGWQHLSDTIGRILGQLDPNSPSGRAIITSLENAFSGVANKVSDFLKPENIDRFAASVEKAGKGLEVAAGWAGKLVDLMGRAADFAEVVTKPLQYIMDHTGHGSGNKELDALIDARNQGRASPQDVTDYFSNPEHQADFAKLDAENRQMVLDDVKAAPPRSTNVTVPQINVNISMAEGQVLDEEAAKHHALTLFKHFNNFVERSADEDGE